MPSFISLHPDKINIPIEKYDVRMYSGVFADHSKAHPDHAPIPLNALIVFAVSKDAVLKEYYILTPKNNG